MAFSRKQLEIFKFPYQTECNSLICDGAVRSGKTICMVFAFIIWACSSFNGMNFAICGKTVRSAERNVLRPLMGLTYLQQHYKLKYNSTAHLLTISKGNKTNYFYIFGGKDEGSAALIQGITLAGLLLDEVALMPESFVNQALARCSVEGAKYWFNCNPESPQHWFYQKWILNPDDKKKITHLHFLMSDNPSLSAEKLAEYETMYEGVFYRRFILGEWTKAEGLVYPMFDEEKHCTQKYDIRGQYYISIDYGTVNPTVFLLWSVNKNRIVLCKEYYYNSRQHDEGKVKAQKTDEEYYNDLCEFASGHTIERIIIDPSAASFKETIKRHRQFLVKDANNDVLDGIRFTATIINSGLMQIDSNCINTISEFGAYVWDEKSVEDKVLKENDHAMDAMRYFLYTVIRKEVKARGEL